MTGSLWVRTSPWLQRNFTVRHVGSTVKRQVSTWRLIQAKDLKARRQDCKANEQYYNQALQFITSLMTTRRDIHFIYSNKVNTHLHSNSTVELIFIDLWIVWPIRWNSIFVVSKKVLFEERFGVDRIICMDGAEHQTWLHRFYKQFLSYFG